MKYAEDPEIVSTVSVAEGDQVVHRDVLVGGQLSILKSPGMRCKTPGHAEVVASILNDPFALLFVGSGRITQEHIDKAAEAINERRKTETGTG